MPSDQQAKEAIGGCVGLIVIGLIVWFFVRDDDDGPPQTYPMTETVSIDSMSYRVLDAVWRDEIGELKPDARFLVLRLRVRNDAKKAHGISASFMLVDEHGSEHSLSGKAWGKEKNTLGVTDVINPGVEKTGIVVFDVPENEYKLYLSSGVLKWKEDVLIELKIEPK